MRRFGFVVILLLVWAMWASLEVVFYGEVQPRVVDDIIGTILVISLFKNFDHWYKGKV